MGEDLDIPPEIIAEAKGLIKAPEQVWRDFERETAIIEGILQIAKLEKMKREEEEV